MTMNVPGNDNDNDHDKGDCRNLMVVGCLFLPVFVFVSMLLLEGKKLLAGERCVSSKPRGYIFRWIDQPTNEDARLCSRRRNRANEGTPKILGWMVCPDIRFRSQNPFIISCECQTALQQYSTSLPTMKNEASLCEIPTRRQTLVEKSIQRWQVKCAQKHTSKQRQSERKKRDNRN